MTRPKTMPLAFLALKTKVGRDRTDELALPLLIHLDAVHRGQGHVSAENALIRLVVMGTNIGTLMNSRAFFDVATLASDKLMKACRRGDGALSLTTTEYQAVRKLVNAYLRVLPTLQMSTLVKAAMSADDLILSYVPT